MKNLDFVDSTRIGVVGYSWGGFAGAILAMSKSEIDAVISLDGSEFHHYGSSKEEDVDFDATVNSPVFKRASIKVPYFRLQSAGNIDKEAEKKDSLYNFEGKLIGKKEIYKIKSANHQDFSCLPSVVKESGQCPTSNTYRLISNLTIKYFNQILKQEIDAFDKEVASNANKTIIPVAINEIN